MYLLDTYILYMYILDIVYELKDFLLKKLYSTNRGEKKKKKKIKIAIHREILIFFPGTSDRLTDEERGRYPVARGRLRGDRDHLVRHFRRDRRKREPLLAGERVLDRLFDRWYLARHQFPPRILHQHQDWHPLLPEQRKRRCEHHRRRRRRRHRHHYQ